MSTLYIVHYNSVIYFNAIGQRVYICIYLELQAVIFPQLTLRICKFQIAIFPHHSKRVTDPNFLQNQ